MYPNKSNPVVLFSCSDETELHIMIGLLRENNVDFYLETPGLGHITGEKEKPITEYRIIVGECDLPNARQLVENSKKVFMNSGYEDVLTSDYKKKHKVVVRILLVLTSTFFATVSYYTFMTSEKFMGAILGGASFFFLVVFIFSFDWGQRNRGK